MGMTNIYMGSLRYGPTGKRRKNHAANPVRRKPRVNTSVMKPDTKTLERQKAAQEHKEKYPSMMEQMVKDGTFASGGNTTGKKEAMQYTGERKLIGIATMHKSNAVPIFESDKEHAKDIAKMRR